MPTNEKVPGTPGHKHDKDTHDVDESYRGRKGGPDVDVEKRQKDLDKQAGHTSERSLAT